MSDKTTSNNGSSFAGWLADNETLHCALQDGGGGKVLLLTDRRLVMLIRVGRKLFTDSEEVLLKNFLGVRQYRGYWSSRLEISVKTACGDITTWRYDGIKKDHAATAYSRLKDLELIAKSKPPKKKPIDEKKHPDINLEFKLNNWESKKDEPKK